MKKIPFLIKACTEVFEREACGHKVSSVSFNVTVAMVVVGSG